MSIIKDFMVKLKEERPDAAEFLALCGEYGGLLDDVIDVSNNPLRVKALCVKSQSMYNCKYWRRWAHVLSIPLVLSRNQYFDSVLWESAEEQWKREWAKVYSHAGIHLILAVALIEYGQEIVDDISMSLREEAYTLHKGDKI